MDSKILIGKKDKIFQIIKNHKAIYSDYKDFIETILKPNERNIRELYLLILPGHNDFEKLVDTAYKNVGIVTDIIQKYIDILDSIKSENEISENYLNLIINTLKKSITVQNLQINLQSARNLYEQVNKDDFSFQTKNVFINILYNILSQTANLEDIEYLQLAQIYAFKFFSNPDRNFVIIGANGSGKSSFARNSRKVLSKNVAIIPAQKIFILSNIKDVSLGKSSRETLWSYQTDDKLCKDSDFIRQLERDLQTVYKSLVEEQNSKANEYFEKNKTSNTFERKETVLEKVISIWNEIIIVRNLVYKEGSLDVINPATNNKYKFMNLSDGEKAVFYYISHVLLAKPDSFIIVDEPENHLHLALVTKLWNRLEQERKDCRFIYLTHNLDFAASRVNSEKLWIRDFTPPAQWNIEKLPTDENLPEILYMELLGSRKPILFVKEQRQAWIINFILVYFLIIQLFHLRGIFK